MKPVKKEHKEGFLPAEVHEEDCNCIECQEFGHFSTGFRRKK